MTVSVLSGLVSQQVDAIVVSVNNMGFFAEVGPLSIFISSKVGTKVVWLSQNQLADRAQMMASEIKWDPNATPPQYTDNLDQVIEKGTHVRVKIMGTRSEVGSMYAVGSMKEDFLGFVYLSPSISFDIKGAKNGIERFDSSLTLILTKNDTHARNFGSSKEACLVKSCLTTLKYRFSFRAAAIFQSCRHEITARTKSTTVRKSGSTFSAIFQDAVPEKD